jgi:DNA-binding HxlR family transcriptional regulator
MATEAALSTARTLLADDGIPDNCPTRAVFDQLTSRWATLIVAALLLEPHRFAQLRRRVDGISDKMLAQNLKMLTEAGLVSRDVEDTVPPKVTYALTAFGEDFAGPLCALIGWIGAHADELLPAPAEHRSAARAA